MLIRLHHYATVLSKILILICCAMLVVMTATIGALVISRYIFGYSFPWAEELTRYFLIWFVLLAAAVLQYRDDHIRVTVLVEKFPERLQTIIQFFLRLLIIGFSLLLIRYGWSAAIGMGITTSPGLGLSMTVPYLAIPTCGVLMLGFSILSLVDDVRAILGLPRLKPNYQTG